MMRTFIARFLNQWIFWYMYISTNRECTDQTERIRMLTLTFAVRIWHEGAFIMLPIKYFIQSNLDGSNTDGLFTMANSNPFLSRYEILPITRKQIFKEIFIFFRECMLCFLIRIASSRRF